MVKGKKSIGQYLRQSHKNALSHIKRNHKYKNERHINPDDPEDREIMGICAWVMEELAKFYIRKELV